MKRHLGKIALGALFLSGVAAFLAAGWNDGSWCSPKPTTPKEVTFLGTTRKWSARRDNGSKQGLETIWSPDYSDGSLTDKQWLSRKVFWCNGTRHGPETQFDQHGQPTSVVVWDQGRRVDAGAPEPRPEKGAERPDRLAEVQGTMAAFDAGAGWGKCNELSSAGKIDRDVCLELNHAIEQGRTRRGKGRRIVRQYLKNRGLRRIHGYIVANIGDGHYEAARMAYNGYFDIQYPSRRHFILVTRQTDYSSTGRFRIWTEEVGTEVVELKNGFTEEWKIYEESTLGQLWQEVRDAPAGSETSSAAKELLRFLLD